MNRLKKDLVIKNQELRQVKFELEEKHKSFKEL